MSDETKPGAPPAPAKAAPSALVRATRLVGSYGVAVVLLVVLFVLTLVGTFAQRDTSLYDVQRRYFDSVVAVVDVGPISIPLPGGALTLALLGANLVVGGVIRLRRRVATLGVLVAHLGILVLFGGSLVETLASEKGQMTLSEVAPSGAAIAPDRSNRFRSYYEWELVVAERRADAVIEHVIPWGRLEGLEGKTLHASASDLPFEVRVTGWTRNARPRRARSASEGLHGWVLEALEPAKDAEQNVPGARVTLSPRGGNEVSGLVFGGQAFAWSVDVAGATWEIDLRPRTWTLPFTLRLTRFVHETHPGTQMDKEFSSYVTKIEDGVERDVHITMNEPLRHRGYTFYQSGWGPPDAPPGSPHYSTFAVVRNPSDRVPIYACLTIALGLLFHFGRKLVLYVTTTARSRSARAASERATPRTATA
jgi:hypothetical protein